MGADAGSRASHWASFRSAAAAGAAGGDGTGDGGGGGAAAVTTDARELVRAAAGDAATGSFQNASDSGRSHTYCGNCNLSAAGPGYSCSSTDFLSEACWARRGAGGSLRCPRSAGTVRDPGSGAATGAAPSRVLAASGASRGRERSPWPDRTEGAPPTRSRSPCRCPGGGCSCVGKELLVGGNQERWTRVQ